MVTIDSRTEFDCTGGDNFDAMDFANNYIVSLIDTPSLVRHPTRR